MREKKEFDCVVIGGGPGGYVAAIRAAQRGLSTALVEYQELGGTCLNRGCIPSKTLIAGADLLRQIQKADQYGISVGALSFDYAKMKARKDKVVHRLRTGLEGLMRTHKVTLLSGYGTLLSPHEVAIRHQQEEQVVHARSIILATGSEPRALPHLPFDHVRILDSTSLLNLTELPKKLLIVGGGTIGCEFASLYQTLGVDVTIVELLPSLLPNESKSISDFLTSLFKKRGIRVETRAEVIKATSQKDRVVLSLAGGKELEADLLLVAAGRSYNTTDIGLEAAGVSCNKNGTIPTDAQMRTNVPHIYAIGDITGKWILAHVASHQGLVAADNAAGHPAHINYEAVPSVIFTYPEIGTVGLTLEQAEAAGYQAIVGKFPFQVLGKSQAALKTEGFAQMVVEKSTGQILGAQVVGEEAATLIAEMAFAISNELTVETITETIHAHPTLAEAWLEAALSALDMPLHFPSKLPYA